jgi:DNA-binding transcriptional ArsR family regulator
MTDLSLLFSEYRRRVLGLLLLHPDSRYHVREIARLTSTTAGTLHRELSKLAKAGVLIRETSGNQVYYQANRDFLIFQELTSILKKTTGLVDVLVESLASLAEKTRAQDDVAGELRKI